MLVLLVAKHPLGSHNVLLWTWHQALDFISFEVVELFLHGQHLVRILQGLFYPERLNRSSGGAQLKSKVWQRTSKNTIAFSLILFLLVSSWTSHIAHYWSAAIAHSGMLPPCARMHVHVDGKSLRWAPMCMCVRAEAAMGVAVWSSPSGWRPGGLAVKHQDRGAGAQR
jgi:hypothetical protein